MKTKRVTNTRNNNVNNTDSFHTKKYLTTRIIHHLINFIALDVECVIRIRIFYKIL